MKNRSWHLFLFSCIILLSVQLTPASAQDDTQYDIVLMGGRVIDPETKLDGIRNVGILNNRIAQVSTQPLKGKRVVNVTGLVVAPGVIVS